jgi:PAS domain S-box-containing protein
MKTKFEIQDQFFEHLLNNFSEGIVVINSDYEITYVSDYLIKLTGYAEEDLVGKLVEDIFPEDTYELRKIFAAGEITSSIKFYKKFTRKDGTQFIGRIRLTRGNDIAGNTRFIVYIKDNTPFQRTQRDILRKAVTIEHLSKSRKIRNGELENAILEILQFSSRSMNTQRINAWVFNEDQSKIECIGNFDDIQNKLVEQQTLSRINMPNYFKLFESEKIIISSDAMHDSKTSELVETYLKPHNIYSLMDIPIRIEGEMIGVLCFENTHNPRVWNKQEQQFGLVVAQMISLAIETSHRQRVTRKLKAALSEQKVLLKEVQHRVKNNLAIISSLINLQSEKAKDEYHKALFQESQNRLESIAKVHELLYQSQSYTSVDLKHYLEEILSNLKESFSNTDKKIDVITKIDSIMLDVSTAIPLALILNEIVTNSYKHAFHNVKEGTIEVKLTEEKDKIKLVVKDNGSGFDPEKAGKSSLGFHILDGLVEQIDATLNYSGKAGTIAEISFIKS